MTSQIIFDRITCPDKKLICKKEFVEEIKNSNFEILLTAGAGDICDMLPQIVENATMKP